LRIRQEGWIPDSFRIYESEDRFAPWPWTVLGETSLDVFDAVGHLIDGRTHFYVVRGVKGSLESGNSSVLVKAELAFDFEPAATNLYFVSLPHGFPSNPPFQAGALAAELTDPVLGPNVDALFRWNSAANASAFYAWIRNAWRGTDFALDAGDGFWLGSRRPFTWAVLGNGTTVTLAFTAGQDRWISLPYTSTYRTASDIVRELEGSLNATANTKVTEVAIWDAAAQSLRRFSWTPAGWTGDDFAITIGVALRVSAVATFSWDPRILGGS